MPTASSRPRRPTPPSRAGRSGGRPSRMTSRLNAGIARRARGADDLEPELARASGRSMAPPLTVQRDAGDRPSRPSGCGGAAEVALDDAGIDPAVAADLDAAGHARPLADERDARRTGARARRGSGAGRRRPRPARPRPMCASLSTIARSSTASALDDGVEHHDRVAHDGAGARPARPATGRCARPCPRSRSRG